MELNLIYNRTNQNIIGFGNELAVYIKEDIKRFKQITSNKPNNVIIMGYNTWKSLPCDSLPGRINIVLSNNNLSKINVDGVVAFGSFEESIKYLEEIKHDDIFIIGGAQLYDYVINNYYDNINLIYETITNIEIMDGRQNTVTYKDRDYEVKYITFTQDRFMEDYEKIKSEKYNSKIKVFNKEDEVSGEYIFNILQRKGNINYDELEYLNLLSKIRSSDMKRGSRNSSVISSFGEKMKFDLREGFPLLTTKKMGWKTILRELLWFIKGSTDNKELNDKNVHIWDANASEDFMKSRGLDYEKDDLGPIYGFQWRHFGDKYINKNTEYNGGIDQLKYVIDTIKNDPLSRRIIMSAWNPCDIDKMVLPPCHVMVQFYVDVDNNFIDAQLYQRSGDMFLGVPYNIASYSFLLHIICNLTGYKPRYLHHIIGDAHIYENHIESVDKQLSRTPYKFPNLSIEQIKDIDNLEESMFNISDYNCYGPIKTKMIA